MGPSSEPLLGITLGQVTQRAAEKFGDDEAVVSYQQNITKTYSQLEQEVIYDKIIDNIKSFVHGRVKRRM